LLIISFYPRINNCYVQERPQEPAFGQRCLRVEVFPTLPFRKSLMATWGPRTESEHNLRSKTKTTAISAQIAFISDNFSAHDTPFWCAIFLSAPILCGVTPSIAALYAFWQGSQGLFACFTVGMRLALVLLVCSHTAPFTQRRIRRHKK
jgi:hypothetical protein